MQRPLSVEIPLFDEWVWSLACGSLMGRDILCLWSPHSRLSPHRQKIPCFKGSAFTLHTAKPQSLPLSTWTWGKEKFCH